MNDAKFFFREVGMAISHYCNENNIPFYYQVLIQLSVLFFLGFCIYIYEKIKERCQKEKDLIKLKNEKRVKLRNEKKKQK